MVYLLLVEDVPVLSSTPEGGDLLLEMTAHQAGRAVLAALLAGWPDTMPRPATRPKPRIRGSRPAASANSLTE